MGKFDGVLLCSDMDGTLLDDKKQISEANKEALRYFVKEGGQFTVATGRVPTAVRGYAHEANPTVPAITHNGASIYDFEKEIFVWQSCLDDRAHEVLDFVWEHYPYCGIEVCKGDSVLICRLNETVLNHWKAEQFPYCEMQYQDIAYPWAKALFLQTPEQTLAIKKVLLESEFANRYHFVQSDICFFELLPKGINKGTALLQLAESLGVRKTVAMGDNDNDLELLQMSDIGIAVDNAAKCIKENADYITVDNNHDALAHVVSFLEQIER